VTVKILTPAQLAQLRLLSCVAREVIDDPDGKLTVDLHGARMTVKALVHGLSIAIASDLQRKGKK
jgi:hypothetical protein